MKTARTQTLDERLNGLLRDWYAWHETYKYGSGFHRGASHTEVSTHHDWHNGASEDRAARLEMEAIDECVQAVPNAPHRWRTALEFQGRNLHHGISIWYSEVLPPTRVERDLLVLEARNKLALALRARNLL